MFNLERGGRNFGVAEEIHEELTVEVADANGFGHVLAYKFLHRGPRLLNRGVARNDVLAIVGEAGRVSHGGIDILQRNWKMNDVEVKIVDTPVLELLLADWLDAVMVVKRIPEFGDKEEIGAFDYAFFDGACNTLARLLFIAVI